MDNDKIIQEARSVTHPRSLSFDNDAGGVGAAILTESGNIYYGVCIDTSSGMGFCAEHSAIAAMITAGESQIIKVAAVWHDDKENKWYVLPPCGRCREFMKQINEKNLEADVILGRNDVKKLKELLPRYEWPAPLDD
jgi:cytidine deaminase